MNGRHSVGASAPQQVTSTDLNSLLLRRNLIAQNPSGVRRLTATVALELRAIEVFCRDTIRQGDTRHTGLRWICVEGRGTIYAARRRYKWPGVAAVVVSVVWVTKGSLPGRFDLDGKAVNIITAYLFHGGGHDDPSRLAANAGKSFAGSFILGMGFTFDDTDKKGVASPLAEMQRLIQTNPRNAERIFPYIGGEEVNTSPSHADWIGVRPKCPRSA